MKIFNIENKKAVMYIQIKNIKAILEAEYKIPKHLLKKAKQLILSNYDEIDEEEFIRFDDKKTVKFLQNLCWIPNYKILRELSEKELIDQRKVLEQKIIDLDYSYNSMQPITQRQCYYLLNERYKTNQKLNDINTYIRAKQGKDTLPISIPLAIDIEQTNIRIPELEVIAGISFDKKKILFAKENGTQFTSQDGLPSPLVGEIIIRLAFNSGMIVGEKGQADITCKTEPTNRFFVAECKIAKDLTKETSNSQTQTRINQKKKTLTAYENTNQQN